MRKTVIGVYVAVVLGGLLVSFGIYGGIAYVVIHYVRKYW